MCLTHGCHCYSVSTVTDNLQMEKLKLVAEYTREDIVVRRVGVNLILEHLNRSVFHSHDGVPI